MFAAQARTVSTISVADVVGIDVGTELLHAPRYYPQTETHNLEKVMANLEAGLAV